jgi:recombination protein RecT
MATTDVVNRTRQQVMDKAEAPDDDRPTVFDLLQRQQPAIEKALPKHLDGDRFARIALTTFRTNPKLAQCSAESFLGAVMVAAQLGLEPGGPLEHAYLSPRWNNKLRSQECQFTLGYRGIIELTRRSGKLISIEAHEVCEADDFEFEHGLEDRLSHKPNLKVESPAYAYYALAKFRDGGHAFVVLSRAKVINDHAKHSETYDKENQNWGTHSPWTNFFDAMARKTCIRALAPYLPLSPELEQAIRVDERIYTRIEPDMADQPALPPGPTPPEPEQTQLESSTTGTPPADPETGEVIPPDPTPPSRPKRKASPKSPPTEETKPTPPPPPPPPSATAKPSPFHRSIRSAWRTTDLPEADLDALCLLVVSRATVDEVDGPDEANAVLEAIRQVGSEYTPSYDAESGACTWARADGGAEQQTLDGDESF